MLLEYNRIEKIHPTNQLPFVICHVTRDVLKASLRRRAQLIAPKPVKLPENCGSKVRSEFGVSTPTKLPHMASLRQMLAPKAGRLLNGS